MTRVLLLGVMLVAAVICAAGCFRQGPAPTPAAGASDAGRPDASSRRPSLDLGEPMFHFADWSDASGIQFVHDNGAYGRSFIMETVCGGMAVFDFDGDGLLDIYFSNGGALPGAPPAAPARHALYRNLGQMTFRDVSQEAGIDCTTFCLGVTVGDVDNDGWPDLFLNNYGSNVLYHNNGDGTFSDATQADTMALSDRVGAGACFLDCDANGYLDLFVGHYVKFSEDDHRQIQIAGRKVYPGPLDYPLDHNVLLRNQGDGSWTDISEWSGVSSHRGTGMGTVAGDFNGDGHADVIVANDEMANFLFRNDGQGRMEEAGVYSGVAFTSLGVSQGSMGVDCADYDNNGLIDCFMTAFRHEKTTLYANLGEGLFRDVSQSTGANDGTAPHVTWGCCLGDLDNDGDRDIFVATGHLDARDDNDVYLAPNLILRNYLIETGTAQFREVGDQSGDGLLARYSSRGCALDDLDNDGDLDLVILNLNERPTVLKNLLRERSAGGRWLQLRLRGRRSNRDAVGARVSVTAGELQLVDEVRSGRGYQSHWGSGLHFGLGDRATIDRIEVLWHGGGSDLWTDVAADQVLTLRQTPLPEAAVGDEETR